MGFEAYSPPLLHTPRLRLEPLLAAHAEVLFGPFSDPALYRYLPTDPPASLDALRDRYRRLESRRSGDGSELWLNWVGFSGAAPACLIEASVLPERVVQVAYFTFAPYQRQGYAREALEAVVGHLHKALSLTAARALLDTRNEASWRLLERVGFKRLRTIVGADEFKGTVSDEFEYELQLARVMDQS